MTTTQPIGAPDASHPSNAAIDYLVVVGGGRMGGAIAGGVIGQGLIGAESVIVVNPGTERCDELRASLGVRCVGSLTQARDLFLADAPAAPCILLAVKPQVLPSVLPEVDVAFPGVLAASVAVGIDTQTIEDVLASGSHVVKVMPNTPAMVGEGMAVVSGGSRATEADVAAVTSLFIALGAAVIVDESLQNVSSAISGSGPAYFALIVRGLEDAGVARGLDRATARELAVATMVGTGRLFTERGLEPNELMQQVASPGGTTLAALGVLEGGDLTGLLDRAVGAAIARAEELGSR